VLVKICDIAVATIAHPANTGQQTSKITTYNIHMFLTLHIPMPVKDNSKSYTVAYPTPKVIGIRVILTLFVTDEW
jgi:hypothetical protein